MKDVLIQNLEEARMLTLSVCGGVLKCVVKSSKLGKERSHNPQKCISQPVSCLLISLADPESVGANNSLINLVV